MVKGARILQEPTMGLVSSQRSAISICRALSLVLLYAVRQLLANTGSHQVTYSAVYYLSHIPGIENIQDRS